MKNSKIKKTLSRHSKIIVILSFVLILFCAGMLAIAFHQPREEGCFSDLGSLTDIEIWKFDKRLEKVELTESDHKIWLMTCFRRASDSEYPGETPDYHINLFVGKKRYTALYNENSDIIFLSLVSEFRYSYGWFSAPSPGGWTQPLYVTNASKELLKVFGLK